MYFVSFTNDDCRHFYYIKIQQQHYSEAVFNHRVNKLQLPGF